MTFVPNLHLGSISMCFIIATSPVISYMCHIKIFITYTTLKTGFSRVITDGV